MAVSGIGGATPATSASTGAGSDPTVQLRKDQQKLASDTAANASKAIIAADQAAVAKDTVAIAAERKSSGTDTYA
ncbi:MAG: hypothetical protein QOI35_3940 [Cryptosporangiaceae bacterium]|jgi:hypothetical protein|nr:hypothetical protein [Cryptosporangiaceae bacterium]MDQ1658840.1 hypothetical protein [Cryptosporangiaceae bacterium]